MIAWVLLGLLVLISTVSVADWLKRRKSGETWLSPPPGDAWKKLDVRRLETLKDFAAYDALKLVANPVVGLKVTSVWGHDTSRQYFFYPKQGMASNPYSDCPVFVAFGLPIVDGCAFVTRDFFIEYFHYDELVPALTKLETGANKLYTQMYSNASSRAGLHKLLNEFDYRKYHCVLGYADAFVVVGNDQKRPEEIQRFFDDVARYGQSMGLTNADLELGD